ncbi:MAG: phytoene desaturase family protein [Candidatus Acidiferrales bacterium]
MITRAVGSPYKTSDAREESWDAIVIGSGIGGLTAAALLARHAGKRVLVLERHYVAGGFTHSFHRPGYEWDVGVHYIGEVQQSSSPVRAMFDNLSEGRLEWNPMPEVYDRIRMGEKEYEFVAGLANFRERMKSYFPGDGAAVDCYIAAVLSCAKAMGRFFAEKAVPLAIARVVGSFLRAPFLRWARRTTAEVLAEITPNRELAGVLAGQWGNYGLPPSQSSFAVHATIAAHYFEGASYPIGGAARIAASIAPAIEKTGGKILVSAEVVEILLDRKRHASGVRMSDGREIRAGLVISDAGAANTYRRLLPNSAPGISEVLDELRPLAPSMAHVCLYVGLRQSAAELGLDGTNLWVHPGYNLDANCARSLDQHFSPPLLFISFPSAKDPDFERRHPGRATIEVVAPVPYEWFRRWEHTRWKKRAPEYDVLKEAISGKLREELEKHVPAVSGKIDYAELSTPLSTRHFMNSECGEAYGFAATPARFQARCLTPRTPVRNLYLTGQDAAILGVTGAMFGGVLCASVILRRNLISAITKPVLAATKHAA